MKTLIILLSILITTSANSLTIISGIPNIITYSSTMQDRNTIYIEENVSKPTGPGNWTQYIRFEFETQLLNSPLACIWLGQCSDGSFFSNSPKSHFVIGLRGKILEPTNGGRGITLGHTPNAPMGCNMFPWDTADGVRPGSSQIEIIATATLFSETCYPFEGEAIGGYDDLVNYRISVHANDNGWISHYAEILHNGTWTKLDETLPIRVTFNNDGDEIDDDIFIALIPDTNGIISQDWKVVFTNIEYGWFNPD